MATYGYGYGNFTSQPQQQYAAAASFGYAAYAPTAYAQPQVPVASAGYGYPTPATGGFAHAQKTSEAYGFGGVTSVPTSYSGGSYPTKQHAYATGNTNFSGSKTQKVAAVTPASSTSSSSHKNAYEKVVYNAASSFLSEQAKSNAQKSTEKPTFKLNGQSQDKSWYKNTSNPSNPPKVQQLHYCDVCKISCAGLQTYKEHLNGQKHKKKAAMSTTDTSKLPPGTYKCELCDVVCTGRDAYNAHVKGASHQRTLTLHQKLGKPIPDVKVLEKIIEKPTAEKAEEASSVTASEATTTTTEDTEVIGESYVEDIKSADNKVIGYNCTLCDCRFNDAGAKVAHMKGRRHRLIYKRKVDPKIKVDMRGNRNRRDQSEHGAEEQAWRQRHHEQMRWEQQLRFREEELRHWEHDEYMKRSREDKYWTKPDLNRVNELEKYEWERKEKYAAEHQAGKFPRPGPPPFLPDDRIIMSKHKEIYPGEAELKQLHSVVGSTEKALKQVSDALEEEKKTETSSNNTSKEETTDDETAKTAVKGGPVRVLKGVMRVEALAKGLLLKGPHLSVELVVICTEKPTHTLLKRMGELLPEKLKDVTSSSSPNDKFDVVTNAKEGAIIVTSTSVEQKCVLKVSLTSPKVSVTGKTPEEDEKEKEGKEEVKAAQSVVEDPPDVLDKDKALQALAALRHAKWFQARANHLASCVVTIRVLKDLCHRVPAFKPLDNWSIEVLCEKSLACSFHPLGPGDAFRRVMEAIASGIFLPGGTGLLDPCEKEKSDCVVAMSPQEREDITGAAQLALRLQAFGQLHKIIGVEALKPNPTRQKRSAEEKGENETSNKVPRKEG